MRHWQFTVSKLSMAICSKNATIKLNYLNGKSGSHFSSRVNPRFLLVTGNSLRLLKKSDFVYSRMRETAVLHSCNNYVSRICNRNAYVGEHSKYSVDCHNRSFPPISINLNLRENKNKEKAKENRGAGEGQDATDKQEIRSNTSCGAGVSPNNNKVRFSLAFQMSSLPVMKASTGLGVFKLGNVVQSDRSSYTDTGLPSSPMSITTVTFSSAADRHKLKAYSRSQLVGTTRSQSKNPVKQSISDASSRVCLQNCSVGRNVGRENSDSKNTERAAGLLLGGRRGEPQLKDLSESQQLSCGTHDLTNTDTPVEIKSGVSKAELSSNSRNNNFYEKKQHSETNSSLYWQFDFYKHLQQTSKPHVVVKKKQNLTPSSTSGKDFTNEKVKTQNDKKNAQDKSCRSPVESAKPACYEKLNVDKIIAAVSFHRWSNTPQACESDYQLLESSVRAPMGPTLAERQEEKLRKKARRKIAASRSCISLLLEKYKKNRQRCPPSVTTAKRRRKRLVSRKKTVRETRAM